ncbi:biliverdin-producing heme oxygenase [Altererythrobacter lutimaris]|uniref:Biliverdin-producing heme oxygenase n=1 Tax=Altererythrobacter lutimaris TaxID=2743979 RepID=A0A850HEQ0_9SPHN|nr:biliverdin-producing heme oxygenase [Altererythrobacter lutimaris]NVE95671.1 biliverdin-producing heme oxygenase [Altererythrobacter lutimaris]
MRRANANHWSRGSGRTISYQQTQTKLRDILRASTRAAHDRLDAVMSHGGWTSAAGYTQFLQVQHAARAPIELWIAERCPTEFQPPRQSHLLEQDLAAMEASAAAPIGTFDLPQGADPLGAVWALAGSSLGNAMIQRQVAASSSCAHLPQSFLTDQSMHRFWKSLLPVLNSTCSREKAQASCRGANAVFAHFLRAAETSQLEAAA